MDIPDPNLSNLDLWNLAQGFFLPLLIALFQQPKWTNGVRTGVTVAVCILAGTMTANFQGAYGGHDIARSVLLTLISTMTFYRNVWKPTLAPALEKATSPAIAADISRSG